MTNKMVCMCVSQVQQRLYSLYIWHQAVHYANTKNVYIPLAYHRMEILALIAWHLMHCSRL